MFGFSFGPRRLVLGFILLIAFASLCPAVELDPEEFMPVEEIKPGMKGYGLTVFSGTKIDTFQVEILGVRRSTQWPRWDLIWARLAGGPLEKAGVIAGMSGSPVYLEDRLIGAVGYGFWASKEPLAGITPIEQMFDTFEGSKGLGTPGKNWQGGLDEYPGVEWGVAPEDLEKGVDAGWGSGPGLGSKGVKGLPGGGLNLEAGVESRVVPLATPLMISGVDHQAFEMMSPVLKGMGFLPLQTGGASVSEVESPELEPGAGVGVQFMRGDLNLYGYGTLTYRKGKEILAFGHPMMFEGETNMPMITVDIHFVVPSIIQSFKYGSAIDLVGAVTQDRVSAIAGVVDQIPNLTPVAVQVTDAGATKEFNYEIIKHKQFTPMLIRIGVLATIGAVGKLSGDYAVGLKTEVNLEGHPPFAMEDFFSGNGAPFQAGYSVYRTFTQLLGNDFEQVNAESVSMELSLLEQRRSAVLEGIRVDKDAIRPGDPIEVTLFVRPYLEDTQTKRISLEIPEDVPEGMLELRVYDARTAYGVERWQAPHKFRPRNMTELIGLVRESPRNNEFVVDLFLRRTGATVGALELPSLPASMLAVLKTTRQAGGSGLTQGTNVARRKIAFGYVVAGSKTLPLRIDRRAR